MSGKQKITTFLWFDDNAEEAIAHYLSVFKTGRIVDEVRHGGALLTATFEIEGQQFMALNGGPRFKFTEAISLVVSCETQAEVDACWDQLSAGGAESQCGWLKDRFGLSWQIVPTALVRLLRDPDPGRSGRAMQAMLGMQKLDIAALERAADQA